MSLRHECSPLDWRVVLVPILPWIPLPTLRENGLSNFSELVAGQSLDPCVLIPLLEDPDFYNPPTLDLDPGMSRYTHRSTHISQVLMLLIWGFAHAWILGRVVSNRSVLFCLVAAFLVLSLPQKGHHRKPLRTKV